MEKRVEVESEREWEVGLGWGWEDVVEVAVMGLERVR